MLDLMMDPFGNYLAQKLIENSTPEMLHDIIFRVQGDLVSISMNMHGTRVVQKMIEHTTTPGQRQFVVEGLRHAVVTLIKDLNGNHVIQRCLHKLVAPDNQFIYDAVAEHCVRVATHRHGCCVLQRCIDYGTSEQKSLLVSRVVATALVLVQDPFGNYVVQYVLELNVPLYTDSVVEAFVGHLDDLSVQKFSSNVIEKSLNMASAGLRKLLVKEIINSEKLLQLLQDPFANYVVQTALTIADTDDRHSLVEKIKPHLNILRNTPYGKRIQNRIAKELAQDGGATPRDREYRDGGYGGKHFRFRRNK
eukprot:GCRY01004393.1.p1 GENE.GCRY01004393.1~~GCRY01004393.1.p1  ORF type:complete len:306 (-),score=111.21 GCRY01004393.1:9-926(-)